MNKSKFLAYSGKAGIVLNAALFLTLTGCGQKGDATSPAAQTQSPAVAETPAPATVQSQPPAVVEVQSPVVETQDEYVYYPNYGIYYNSSRHQYASLEGGAWISEPAPRGVAEGELRASPSVKMNFHDAPASHHAEIARQYPKNWKP
jgi:predicted small lipoprotein YifL